MQAVILAGGLGTRLRPLTQATPKCMIKINNKPFLEYQLMLLKKYNITNILICAGYLHEQIMDYFKNGKDFGLNITYSIEEQPLGTGGALKKAKDLLHQEFLLLYGDSYLPVDYLEIVRCFKKNNVVGLMVVYDNKELRGVENNVLVKNNVVLEYSKKEKKTTFNGIEAGVLMFKKEIIKEMPEREVFSLEEEIFQKLIQKKQMKAFVTNQSFYDIGTLERLKHAEEVLLTQ